MTVKTNAITEQYQSSKTEISNDHNSLHLRQWTSPHSYHQLGIGTQEEAVPY